MIFRRSAATLFLAAIALVATAGAHPVHATFAEAVWNPKTKSVEVALRVRGLDLEEALSKGREKRVDLDKTEGIDRLIGAYLDKNFTVAHPDGTVLKPKWSDKEVGIKNTWLYFEFPFGEGKTPKGCKIRNTVFFDDLDGQKNVIEYRAGQAKRILEFEGKVREIAIVAKD